MDYLKDLPDNVRREKETEVIVELVKIKDPLHRNAVKNSHFFREGLPFRCSVIGCYRRRKNWRIQDGSAYCHTHSLMDDEERWEEERVLLKV